MYSKICINVIEGELQGWNKKITKGRITKGNRKFLPHE